jgi:indole-3-glycerol phosphate synthase
MIAEIKRRSPSKGPLCLNADVAAIARSYEASGAAAVSVLTDHDFFGGSDDDLRVARGATSLPTLRKDFTIDAYQIHEARVLGADAVLLIARVLTDGRLSEWVQLCAELQLTALVEVHDENELQAALDARATVIGVNSRDLRTFKTDLAGAIKLRALIPAATLAVAESGIHTPDDIQAVTSAGFDAGLVGEALMTASDPGAALRALTGRPS